ncbi:hypothetical protein ACJMK2_003729 [Sinanodonta woodiana]|uniref:Uncharacterized protein n=1 Tax=Sinanodonta woodiana TaxID=1069815 RepID=A0ABD3XZ26_SINWO
MKVPIDFVTKKEEKKDAFEEMVKAFDYKRYNGTPSGNWSTLRERYDQFCEETSLTVLSRIHNSKNIYKTIAWIVLTLAMLIWMFVECYWLFTKYFQYPVEVKTELRAVPRHEFPSVTVCNLNPLKDSRKRDEPFNSLGNTLIIKDDDMLYNQYVGGLQERLRDNKTQTFGPTGGNFTNGTSYDDPHMEAEMQEYMKNNSFKKWEALENETLARAFYYSMDAGFIATFAYSSIAMKLDSKFIESYGHQKDDLIMSCKWQGMQCSPENFTYIWNMKHGNCYTFNSGNDPNPALSINYAGPLMGLVLELNIEQEEYISALSPEAGVRVVIHKRGTYPFPEDEGINIAPGFMTSLGLKKTVVSRLPPPHADCGTQGVGVNFYTDKFGVEYTKQTCVKSCYQSVIIDKCKCAFPFFYVPPEAEICNTSSQLASCVDQVCQTDLEKCNDQCPSSCEESRFEPIMSISKWPSEKYSQHLSNRIRKTSSKFMDDDKVADSTNTLAKLEVYFVDMSYERIEQQKSYQSESLISDIGGQLGLWLGLSVITLGELVEFMASVSHLITARFYGRVGNRSSRKSTHHLTKVQPALQSNMEEF